MPISRSFHRSALSPSFNGGINSHNHNYELFTAAFTCITNFYRGRGGVWLNLILPSNALAQFNISQNTVVSASSLQIWDCWKFSSACARACRFDHASYALHMQKRLSWWLQIARELELLFREALLCLTPSHISHMDHMGLDGEPLYSSHA